MGLYKIYCTKCKKPFMWWSGTLCQICPECIDNEMGGGVHVIERKLKKPIGNTTGHIYSIGYNEAETYEDAVKLLIERGVPEDEIINYEK